MQPILSKRWDDVEMVLVDKKTLRPIMVGDLREDFRGEVHVVVEGSAPHKESSSGRVYTYRKLGGDPANTAGYFPSIIEAEWIEYGSAK